MCVCCSVMNTLIMFWTVKLSVISEIEFSSNIFSAMYYLAPFAHNLAAWQDCSFSTRG